MPLVGDEVQFKLCPIPPKFVKFQAVDVHLENIDINLHRKWNEPFDPAEETSGEHTTQLGSSPVREPIKSSID